MTVRIEAARVFRWHLLAITLLGILNLAVIAGDAAGYHGMLGFSPLFRLNAEGNAPSLFSALALVAAALVAARNAQAPTLRVGERRGWLAFAWLLGFMALDEAVALHEMLNRIGPAFHASPWLVAGVFVYALAGLFLAIHFFRFWAGQSPPVRWGMAMGVACYLISAMGMEMAEFTLSSANAGPYDSRLAALYAVEELGEMLAVALFLRTFLVRFLELGGGPLLALVGARPLLAVEIVPASEQVDAADPEPLQLAE